MLKPRSALGILGASLYLLFGASQAHAGDAACVWNGIPDDYRLAFLAAYPDEGRRAFVRLNPPGEVFGPIMVGCGVRDHRQVDAATKALIAFGFDEGAARLLQDRFGVPRSQIDAAWGALPAERRDAFYRSVLPGAENAMPASAPDPELRRTAISVVEQIAGVLKVDDPVASDQLGVYLTWKVVRPLYEAEF